MTQKKIKRPEMPSVRGVAALVTRQKDCQISLTANVWRQRGLQSDTFDLIQDDDMLYFNSLILFLYCCWWTFYSATWFYCSEGCANAVKRILGKIEGESIPAVYWSLLISDTSPKIYNSFLTKTLAWFLPWVYWMLAYFLAATLHHKSKAYQILKQM